MTFTLNLNSNFHNEPISIWHPPRFLPGGGFSGGIVHLVDGHFNSSVANFQENFSVR
jgi:hypothetical protein